MDSANIMVLFCLFNENGIFLNKKKKILRFNSYICRSIALRDDLERPLRPLKAIQLPRWGKSEK